MSKLIIPAAELIGSPLTPEGTQRYPRRIFHYQGLYLFL